MTKTERQISTGIETLDDIMHGGFTADRLYLIEGYPGTGKTTLAMQFLLDGVAKGERVLYVSLSETREELEGVAASHGWSLDGIDIHELVDQEKLTLEQSQTKSWP
jgi:circadian clock protein KaiC